MTPLYDTDQLARLLYNALIAVWLGSEVLVFVTHVRVEGDRRQDRLSGPAVILGVFLAIAAGGAASRDIVQATITWHRELVFGLGVGLALAGVALRWYAIVSLGRFFTMRVEMQEGHRVVETGPYRLIRHPSYTGALMTLLGVLLCATNWVSLLCFLLAWPGFAYRISVEERALVGALGDAYRDYTRRSKRLVPYLI